MVRRLFLTAAALLTSAWALPGHAIVAEIDDFAVGRNGSIIFQDSFDDGMAPPSAPDFASGRPASYSVFGSFPPGSESGGLLQLNSANGGTTVNAMGGVRKTQSSILQTTPSADGLGIDDVLLLQAVFNLTTPVGPLVNGYEVAFTDAAAGVTHQLAGLQVAFVPANGEARIRYQLQDFDVGTITVMGSVPFLPPPGADQILLQIARPDTGNEDFYASYQYLSGGNPIGGGDFATPAALFDDEDFVRARFSVFAAVVPEPSTLALLAGGLGMLAVVIRTRRRLR